MILKSIVNIKNVAVDLFNNTSLNKLTDEADAWLGLTKNVNDFGNVSNSSAKSFGGLLKKLVSMPTYAKVIVASVASVTAIVVAFKAFYKSIDDISKKTEELMSTYSSAISTANNTAKSAKNLESTYEELSKGVDGLGRNVSLTEEEFQTYHDTVNQIADLFPTLIRGYDDEGNAILNLKDNVEDLRDAYESAQKAAYNLLITDNNDIIKNYQNQVNGKATDLSKNSSIIDGYGGAKDAIGIVQKLLGANTSDEFKELYDELYRENKDIWNSDKIQDALKSSGISDLTSNWSKITNEDVANIKASAQAVVQTYQAEIDSNLANVKSLAEAYLNTNSLYDGLSSDVKTVASELINSIDEEIANGFTNQYDVSKYVYSIVGNLKNNKELSNALTNLYSLDTSNMSIIDAQKQVDDYIDIISKALSENPIELKARLGFDDVDVLRSNYDSIMNSAIEKYGTSNSALNSFAEKNSINTQDEIAFWNQCIEESETLQEAMNKYLDVANETTTKFSTKEMLNAINDISSSVDLIDGIYQDIKDGETFDFTALSSEDFTTAFGDLNSFEDFIEVIANSPSDLEACQEAFNNLTSEFINQTDILDNLTEENSGMTIQMLEQMGIANANEIVTKRLAIADEELALQERAVTECGKDLYDVSANEAQGFLLAADGSLQCSEAMLQLYLNKILCNNNWLNTDEDINAVLALANAAGITCNALTSLAKVKSLYDKAVSNGNDKEASNWQSIMQGMASSIQDEVSNYSYTPKASYTGNQASNASSSSDSTDEWKQAYEDQKAELDSLLARELISYKDYYDQLEALYVKYYKGREKYADEARDAEDDLHDLWTQVYDEERSKVDELYSHDTVKTNDYTSEISAQHLYIEQLKELNAKYYENKEEYAQEYSDLVEEIYKEEKSYMDNLLSSANNVISHLQNMGQYTDTLKNTSVNNSIQYINDLKTAYESYADEQSEMWEYEETIYQLREEYLSNWIDLAQNVYSDALNLMDDYQSSLSSYISVMENQGGVVGSAIYEAQLSTYEQQLDTLKSQYEAVNKSLSQGLSSGLIQSGDANWNTLVSKLNDITSSIGDTESSIAELQDTISKLNWTKFDDLYDALNNISSVISNLNSMFESSDLYKDDGSYTNEGMAQLALYAQARENAIYTQQKIQEELNDLQEQYVNGEIDLTDYTERYNSLISEQYDTLTSQMSATQSMIDMITASYQAQIDAINDEADATATQLEYEQALYDLEQARSNRTQMTFNGEEFVYTTDSDAIKDAEQSLADLEKNKAVNELQKVIDDITNGITDIDELLAETIENLNDNSSTIHDTLIEYAEKYGITIDDTIIDAWLNSSQALTDYGVVVSETTSTFSTLMSSVEVSIDSVYEQAEIAASAIVTMLTPNTQYIQTELSTVQADIGLVTEAFNAAIVATQLLNSMDVDNVTYSIENLDTMTNVATEDVDALSEAVEAIPNKDVVVTTTADACTSSVNTLKNTIESLKDKTVTITTKYVVSNSTGVLGLASSVSPQVFDKGGIVTASQGTVVSPGSPLDIIAKSLGEDTMIAAKKGERVLTPVQNDYWEKWTTSLPDLTETLSAIKDGSLMNYSDIFDKIVSTTSTAPSYNIEVGDINMYEVNDVETFGSVIRKNIQNVMKQI